MKKLFLPALLCLVASSLFAQVGAVRIPQQVGPASGQQAERLVVPSANQILGFDSTKKLVAIDPITALTNSSGTGVLNHKSVTLTAAQIKALNTTPISLIAAQGAGKTTVLEGPVFVRYTRATASFTGGGAFVIQYHTGTIAATGTLAAAQVTGGASTDNVIVPIAAVSVPANDILEITNATADFGGVTAAGTITIDFNYRVL